MAMRMSGLMSGMDTESLVQELVAARQTKVDKQKKAQTKLEWKQSAWKDLNTKLKNLQTKYISNMRFVSSFSKKTTKVSNTSAASVITGDKAVNGVQTLEVTQLAKNGYLTGGKITNNGLRSENAALTTMEELGLDSTTTLNLKIGAIPKDGAADTRGAGVDIQIDKNTTISDVVSALKNAGLNASFDAANGRFFISSKESGEANEFQLTATDSNGENVLKGLGLSEDGGAKKVYAQDAIIKLNDAEFTSSKNTFEINGLTITALSETNGQKVTITTEQDTDGIYDMVKNFLKEYNSIINEMYKLYNADTAKGYEPLTEDEKSVMSDSEVEKYEQKIKDSLLRRDENINSVAGTLKDVMSQGIQIGSKTYYLSDFGINKLSYFTAPDNEKNAYHIDGDSDDENTSGNADVLKGLIASDPNTVITFFTEMSKNLYSSMDKMSKSVQGYRTYGNFYDDKKMASDYSSYTSKIAEMEEALNDYEDKMYSKFSKMETALAKMQSKTTALAGLLGTS